MGNQAQNDLINVMHQCVKEYLSDGTNLFYKAVCGLSSTVDPQQAIHQAIYVQTALSNEFKLDVPDFDIHCPHVYITLLKASKKTILETFYRYFTPEEAGGWSRIDLTHNVLQDRRERRSRCRS